MTAIMATIQGLRNLDNWPECEAKKILIEERDRLDCPINRKHLIFYDPEGNEISLFEWAVCMESVKNTIESTEFTSENEESIRISTVWLGNNHSFHKINLHIFETMVFGIEDDENLRGYQERYSTISEAKMGHKDAVDLVYDYVTKKKRKLKE